MWGHIVSSGPGPGSSLGWPILPTSPGAGPRAHRSSGGGTWLPPRHTQGLQQWRRHGVNSSVLRLLTPWPVRAMLAVPSKEAESLDPCLPLSLSHGGEGVEGLGRGPQLDPARELPSGRAYPCVRVCVRAGQHGARHPGVRAGAPRRERSREPLWGWRADQELGGSPCAPSPSRCPLGCLPPPGPGREHPAQKASAFLAPTADPGAAPGIGGCSGEQVTKGWARVAAEPDGVGGAGPGRRSWMWWEELDGVGGARWGAWVEPQPASWAGPGGLSRAYALYALHSWEAHEPSRLGSCGGTAGPPAGGASASWALLSWGPPESSVSPSPAALTSSTPSSITTRTGTSTG